MCSKDLTITILCSVFKRRSSITRNRLLLLLITLRNVYPELRNCNPIQDLAKLRDRGLISFYRKYRNDREIIYVKPRKRLFEKCKCIEDKDIDELVGTLLRLRNKELAMLINLLN